MSTRDLDAVSAAQRSERMSASRTAEFVRRLTAPEPAVLAQLHHPDDITTRILGATLEQAELVGMRRITAANITGEAKNNPRAHPNNNFSTRSGCGYVSPMYPCDCMNENEFGS